MYEYMFVVPARLYFVVFIIYLTSFRIYKIINNTDYNTCCICG